MANDPGWNSRQSGGPRDDTATLVVVLVTLGVLAGVMIGVPIGAASRPPAPPPPCRCAP